MNQRRASPHTIAAYRDTFRLLLQISLPTEHASSPPSWPSSELDAPLVAAFLDHLECGRHNKVENPKQPTCCHPLAVWLRRGYATPSTPDRFSVCWPSRRNAVQNATS